MEKNGKNGQNAAPLVVKQSVDTTGAKSPVVKPVQVIEQTGFKFDLRPIINLAGKPINGGGGKMMVLGISTAVLSLYSVAYLHGYTDGYKAGKTTGGGETTEVNNAAGGGESEGKNVSGGGEPHKIAVATFVNMILSIS